MKIRIELTEKEKNILIDALGLLIDKQNDTIKHAKLIKKLLEVKE